MFIDNLIIVKLINTEVKYNEHSSAGVLYRGIGMS